MNKQNLLIILLVGLVLLIPPILAEEKFIEDSIDVKIENNILIIETNNILDDQREIKVTNLNENLTLDETYSWILRADVQCGSEDLLNHTNKLTDITIEMLNLSRSCIRTLENLTITGIKNPGEDYIDKYNNCIIEKGKLITVEDAKKQKNNGMMWVGFIGLVVAGLAFNKDKLARLKGKTDEDRMRPEAGTPGEGKSIPLKIPKQ